MITVSESPDGSWCVIRNFEVVVSGLPTNAAAWRAAERLDLRPNWKTFSQRTPHRARPRASPRQTKTPLPPAQKVIPMSRRKIQTTHQRYLELRDYNQKLEDHLIETILGAELTEQLDAYIARNGDARYFGRLGIVVGMVGYVIGLDNERRARLAEGLGPRIGPRG